MKNSIKKIIAAVMTAAIFAYLLYIFFVPPDEGGAHIQCLSKSLFNINCFSCGMTRFVYYAMHGDFAAAFSYNIFAPLLLLILGFIYFLFIRWAFFDKHFPNIPVWAVLVFLVFISVYTILRNLPFEALKWLAPPS